MSDSTSHDLLVIGAGVAGLAAAREALRAGLSTAYLEAQMFGGLVLNVNELDGATSGSGAELASTMMEEVADLGGENLEAVATGLDADGDTLVVTSDAGRHRARAVIVASGAALKKLGIPGESELEGQGVSHCADCDGPMFQGQTAMVVGGGDSALQSVLVLAQFCATVHLVHRGAAFRAKPHLAAAAQAAANVRVHWNTQAEAVLGAGGVEGVRVRGGTNGVLACSGFFAFIGVAPATGFLPAAVARDAGGAVVTDAGLQTALPGVYAAGAVRAGCGGMIDDAMAEGVAAAQAVVRRLAAQPA